MNFVFSARGSRALSRMLLASAAVFGIATAAQAAVVISTKPTKHMTCSAGVCTPTKSNAVLNVNDLTAMLAAGDATVISDSNALDIIVAAPFTWTSKSRLTLTADNSIIVQQPVTVAGRGALTLSPDQNGKNGPVLYQKKGHVTFWDMRSNVVVSGATYSLVKSISALRKAIAANSSGNYALANDYDASLDGTYGKSPIAEFYGYAEGLGNTISHLTIKDGTAGDNVGLFAFTGQQSRVDHFRLAMARVSGGSGPHVGALVGQADGSLLGDVVSGSVNAGDGGHVGGIVGEQDEPGSSWFCESSATVSSGHTSRTGGIVGEGYETYHSSASGNVSILDGWVGGIGGDAGVVAYSHATGNVAATGADSQAGGLAGVAYEIDYSYATGQVTAEDTSWIGGLAGSSSTTKASFAAGAVNVMGEQDIAGGLLGQAEGLVWNSYATGAVSAGENGHEAGGLVGYYTSAAQIYITYAVGTVSGGQYTGGIAGFADPGAQNMTSTYWDLDTSGISDPSQAVGNIPNEPGAIGLTTQQFKAGLPDGFDPNMWAENPNINNGYPYLLANPPPK